MKDNSLLQYPEVLKQWNHEKNIGISPDSFSSGSRVKVWWKCEKGHEWQATISNRIKGRGCPVCANRIIVVGYNDLATTNPRLAKEWNYKKNGDLTPKQVAAGSTVNAWWVCEKGHEWQTKVLVRNRGYNCPFCSGKKVLKGFNDLASNNPLLAREWNYLKNKGLSPEEVTSGSNKK